MSELGQRIISLVREIASAKPDFVYVSPVRNSEGENGPCVYVHDGKPSCLLGQALWVVGLIDADIDPDPNNTGIESLIRGRVDRSELNWLGTVQACQDTGVAWHGSVECADAEWSATVN